MVSLSKGNLICFLSRFLMVGTLITFFPLVLYTLYILGLIFFLFLFIHSGFVLEFSYYNTGDLCRLLCDHFGVFFFLVKSKVILCFS